MNRVALILVAAACFLGPEDGHTSPRAVPTSTNIIEIEKDVYPPIPALWANHLTEYKISGKTYIGTIEGNGDNDKMHFHKKRHTIIFTSSLYDNTRDPDVIIWLHGHHGFNKFGIRILRHIEQLHTSGKNPLIIAIEQPWSYWTKTRTKRNGTGPFTTTHQFTQWLDATFKILEGSFNIHRSRVKSSNITLYGHSAGGSGIMALARAGILHMLQPGTIVFSDSTYGRWFDVTYDRYLNNQLPGRDNPTRTIILTQRHGKPWSSMKRFFKERKSRGVTQFPNIIWVPTSLSHKKIGDNCLIYPNSPF